MGWNEPIEPNITRALLNSIFQKDMKDPKNITTLVTRNLTTVVIADSITMLDYAKFEISFLIGFYLDTAHVLYL